MITKYYFINNFDTNNIDKQDNQTIIIYRNYSLTNKNEDFIFKIKKYCKKKKLNFIYLIILNLQLNLI